MGELIRPTLFLVARLGLFFVLMAWVVGHWCEQRLVIPLPHSDIISTEKGWSVSYHPKFRRRFEMTVRPLRGHLSPKFGDFADLRAVSLMVRKVSDNHLYWQQCTTIIFPGVVLFVDPNNNEHSFALRLPFLVTFFALFYGVLKWVYRKRGQELAADE